MNCLVKVSWHLLVLQITTNHPTVRHIREMMGSSQLASKSFSQDFNELAFLFYVLWIISSRHQKSRALDRFSKSNFVSPIHHSLKTKRWMRSSNSNETIILCSHFKSKPNSPTEANCEKFSNTLLTQIPLNFFKTCLHSLNILSFDVGKHSCKILATSEGRVKNFR